MGRNKDKNEMSFGIIIYAAEFLNLWNEKSWALSVLNNISN